MAKLYRVLAILSAIGLKVWLDLHFSGIFTKKKQILTACFIYFNEQKDPFTVLLIREGIEDNSKTIFLISQRKQMLRPLNRTVLMLGHKICFNGEQVNSVNLFPPPKWLWSV